MVEEVVKDNMVVEEDAGDKSGGTENKMTDWVEYVGTVGKHKSRGTNIDMNYIGHNQILLETRIFVEDSSVALLRPAC